MDAGFDGYFKNHEQFSGNVLVSKQNDIIFHASYGYSNREKGKRNSLQSKFMVGSMTKTVTAVCIMQLMEKGLLRITQNIEHYFPVYRGMGITIHNLLCHTSGIPNFTDLKRQIKPGDFHTPQEILEVTQRRKPKFRAGRKWSYCNTNYLMLGLIIEQVSGMAFHQYVREHVLNPLGMKDTTFATQTEPLLAQNYIFGEKGFYVDPSRYFACGDMVSTTHDIYLFIKALYEGDIIKIETLREMEKPHYKGVFVKYGYGLYIENQFGTQSVCHGGSVINGYTSHFERYMNDEVTIVVLSNNLVKYGLLSIKESGGTYVSRELASLLFGRKLNAIKKLI